MAAVVTYALNVIQNLDLAAGPTQVVTDAVSLANGGFAVVGNHAGHTDLDIFSAGLTAAGSAIGIPGTFAAVDQLSNGNIVVVTEGTPSDSFTIRSATGAVVVGPTAVQVNGLPSGLAPNAVDVAALTGGGFVVASEIINPSFDNDDDMPAFSMYNAAGIFLTSIQPIAIGIARPCVAALDDGGFAVAFHDRGESSIRYAVYNANGSQRLGPTFLDFTGSINRNVAITAIEGGFAIAYEDNQASPNTDIALMRFDANGVQQSGSYITLSGPATIDQAPQLARMAGGLLAISFEYSTVSTNDSGTTTLVIDPVAQTLLHERIVTGGEPATDDMDAPVIAAYGDGRLAVFHTNRTDGDVDGEALEFVRTVTGDDAPDGAVGGFFVDVMNGNGGIDQLDGGGANDILNGGAGADILAGGTGFDTADYSEKLGAVVVFLNGGASATVTVGGVAEDTLFEIERVNGGWGADSLVGDGLANLLNGAAGEDNLFSNGFNPDGTLKSAAGNDILNGGAGDDGLFAGDGNDTLNGGTHNDGMVGGAGNDTLNGDAGNDFLFGGAFSAGGARLANSGADTLNGGAGNDGLYGFDGADILNGDGENDYVEGGAGNDVINGGAGSDYLLGEAESDTINGGLGFDYMYGGTGADTFIFRKTDSADWILDFSATQGDKLRILNFGYANFAAIPFVDLSTPGNPAVQLTVTSGGATDQLTIFGATLAQLNATNVLVA